MHWSGNQYGGCFISLRGIWEEAGIAARQDNDSSNDGRISGQAEDIDIQAKEIIRMTDVLNDVLARHTGHKIKKIAHDTQRDYYFSSQEAKDYGIIDEVMQNRKLKAL